MRFWDRYPLFSAFRHRNFRLFYSGQVVSLSGLWMQRVAMNWLVYRITGSPFLLGTVDFVTQFPTLLFGSFTGAFLEGRNLRKVIMICQTISMLHALTLATLTLTGTVQYWHVLVLAAIIGTSDSFEVPARQGFTIRLVEDERDLSNGIALTSTLFNVTRLIGPSVAGMVIAVVGEGLCFLMNGFAYSATLTALALMRFKKPLTTQGTKKNVLESMKEGVLYAASFIPLRNYLLAMAFVSFFAFPYMVLLPVFAREVLAGGPQTLGFLMGASGVGALAGSVRLAMRRSPVGLGKVMASSCALLGVSMAAFSLSRSFALSLVLIALLGFFMICTLVSSNTLVQTLVDDDKRNRVMSLFIVSASGLTPIGSLTAGWLATVIGAPATLFGAGTISLIIGLLLLRAWPSMWAMSEPVYRRKNLI
ncbi:MAG TPA: MFS transporter [Synergistaceae bacterium]|nr:MFS transporter [Synergistaceae bacterium]